MSHYLLFQSALGLLSWFVFTFPRCISHFHLTFRGLDNVLKSGNVSHYPGVCAETTAAFSVLSETVIAVRRLLDDSSRHNRKDLVLLLTRLQQGEKEKLNLTAALHLEKIRAANQEQLDEQQAALAASGCGSAVDHRIASLLDEGVKSLLQKIALSVEEINDALAELQCALLEEREKV